MIGVMLVEHFMPISAKFLNISFGCGKFVGLVVKVL